MTMNKDLKYWKKNAEEDYMKVPISVLRYISELERLIESTEQVNNNNLCAGVSRCFSSESELRLHIETSIPIAIKPTRKSKTTFVYPFTSYKAKEAVVESIVESLLNNG